ncbi:MAG: hypothetical protein JWO03_211 [Bacteroidetes bacterium]|nr:hypothetical protein [Bacteroidota bacterium]
MEENKISEAIILLQSMDKTGNGFIGVEQITRNGELFIKGDTSGLLKLAIKILNATNSKGSDAIYDDDVSMENDAECIIINYDGSDRKPAPVRIPAWYDKIFEVGCFAILALIIFIFVTGIYHIARLFI